DVPNTSRQLALHFRQIKIRTAAAFEQLARVMEEKQTEIEQRARDRRLIDKKVFLIEVPAAWPDQQHRRLLVQFVLFSFRTLKANCPPDRVVQIALARDHVSPRRRI